MKFLTMLALMWLAASWPAVCSPLISEFMADNTRGARDSDGTYQDWIEIKNPDAVAVSLENWCLTDSAAVLTKWRFPAVTIGPGGYLMVFASGKNRAVAGQELHTNFSLDSNGEFLALVRPDGTTVTSQFSPKFPKQHKDISYGFAEDAQSVTLTTASVPKLLVPTGPADLNAAWNQPGFTPGALWSTAVAPLALGYDTVVPTVPTTNVARMTGAAATQSSNYSPTLYQASSAINGSYADFTHTIATAVDPNPWWLVTLPSDQVIQSIKLYNRGGGCCPERMRDITVQVLDAANNALYTSPVLNPGNVLAGPASITVDLVALTGASVTGRKVKVNRAGAASGSSVNDQYALSLGEVEVYAAAGAPVTTDHNLATSGTATQSSTNTSFTAAAAINNDFGDFSHTLGTDAAPTWTLDLGSRKLISSVTLYNRTSCCGSRLRDITIVVLDADTSTVLYTSPLLNPENQGFSYPNGPATLAVDFTALVGSPIIGQYVVVKRTVDSDLSGTQGQGNTDEANVLSLGEVVVMGQDFGSYTPLITTDVKTALYTHGTSTFVRMPFTVADPSILTALKLRIRYDDGFIAYINGTEVARRNAQAGPSVWNSAAPTERDDVPAIQFETIDLTAFLPQLVAGSANVLAIHGMTSVANDPDFFIQPQLIADLVIRNNFASYLRQPTPGLVNDSTWFYDWVSDTDFGTKRGFFTAPFDLVITSDTVGAQIYYTTNAEEPEPGGNSSTLYTGPVTINKTTTLRARAFKADWEPTNTDTNTYLFPADVITQASSPYGTAPANWPASWGANSVNYGMDPAIRTLYGDAQLIESLQQIPSLSIVTEMANLFDPTSGIYSNAGSHGDDWEKPASFEFIDPASPAGQQGKFQVNGGVRIRGGASRGNTFVKHSFRAYFRGSYGDSKLNYPLFGDRGTDQFDVIDIATSQNYSWAAYGPSSGDYDTLVRDPFSRETLGATGSPTEHNAYFHLYLNGLYWGLFYWDERPSAGYGVAYFGGKQDTWDVIKTGNHSQGFVTEATEGYLDTVPPATPGGPTTTAAWKLLWNKCRAFATAPGVTANGNPDLAGYFDIIGRNADGTRNPTKEVLVDIDSLIDYLLTIFYTGDGDAPLSSFLSNNEANNWFCIRDRGNPDRGFVFFNHDAEHTLGTPNSQVDRTGPWNGSNQTNFTYSNPQWTFQDLAFSPEFRLRVADRARKHFFNSGPMTPTIAQARIDGLSAQIDKAIKANAQRWGDTVKSPSYNAVNWQSAVTIARNWLTTRTPTVVQQLKNYRLTTAYGVGTAPLYPNVAAPDFGQFGGNVTNGYQLTMTSVDAAPTGAGSIIYTLDGSDPRAIGGATAGATFASPLPLHQTATVKARTLLGTVWSALTEATFFVDVTPASASNLAISEINYHPANPTTAAELAASTDPDDFEFIELMNIGTSTINLTGVQFTLGIDFTFGVATLQPGQRAVLAGNLAAMQARYGAGVTVAGIYGGKLNNGGEQLTLKTPEGTIIRDFTYRDTAPWPGDPDGAGSSLTLIAPTTNPDHSLPQNWRRSTVANGTPGTDDAASFATWKSAHGIASDADDSDGDGLTALLEYFLGGDPATPSQAPLPTLTISPTTGDLEIVIRRLAQADDFNFVIETSSNLQTWTTAAATYDGIASDGAIDVITCHLPADAGLPHRFVRVRVHSR